MKISKETIAVMKNFASINGNLLIKPGSKLSTLSASKSIYASVDVKEDFPTQFGIYDMNELLSIISLFSDPDFEFDAKKLTIKEGRNCVIYAGASEEVLTAPSKALKIPPVDIEFSLTTSNIDMILKSAGALKAPDICFEGDGETLKVVVGDKKNTSASSYEMVVGETDSKFKAYIRVEHLKVIPGDYKVELAAKKIARLSAGALEYVIVLEADSQFED